MPGSDPYPTAWLASRDDGASRTERMKPGWERRVPFRLAQRQSSPPGFGVPPALWRGCSWETPGTLCPDSVSLQRASLGSANAEPPHPSPQKPGPPDLLRRRWAEPASGETPALHSRPCSSIDCPHPSARLFPSAVQLICLHPSNFIQPPNDLLEEPWGHLQPACAPWLPPWGCLCAHPGRNPARVLRKGLGRRDATWMLFWRVPHPMQWVCMGWEKQLIP